MVASLGDVMGRRLGVHTSAIPNHADAKISWQLHLFGESEGFDSLVL